MGCAASRATPWLEQLCSPTDQGCKRLPVSPAQRSCWLHITAPQKPNNGIVVYLGTVGTGDKVSTETRRQPRGKKRARRARLPLPECGHRPLPTRHYGSKLAWCAREGPGPVGRRTPPNDIIDAHTEHLLTFVTSLPYRPHSLLPSSPLAEGKGAHQNNVAPRRRAPNTPLTRAAARAVAREARDARPGARAR